MGGRQLGNGNGLRVLFWGPEGVGKKTNLEVLHDRTPIGLRGRLVSVRALSDRTLLFERCWLAPGSGGCGFRMLFFAISEPDVYDANVRRLLEEVDAVVHVVGSGEDAAAESQACLARLDAGFAAVGRCLAGMPQVFQFNQRDRSGAGSVEGLRRALDPANHAWTEANALRGDGVVETVDLLMRSMGVDWGWDGAANGFPQLSTLERVRAAGSAPSPRATPAFIPEEVEFYRPAAHDGRGPLDLVPHRR